ncbi:hypothetical protein PAXRUDRAFT_451262 [Paxillus rubicundulus Ve08.2h10]|uniref:Unplaced genomic scaffold scaffold_288, whole genome shotgun sequence n=1 Tax=Paxillus rubicundulus Ve08.2h10 TaxID=930991 RepID=A0A0D0E1W7_9AGAM|nr:hypothetical protein PAXRUDRAFT_451262 [Paxillus rubicundulus Ve08.2h10]
MPSFCVSLSNVGNDVRVIDARMMQESDKICTKWECDLKRPGTCTWSLSHALGELVPGRVSAVGRWRVETSP